ncbi:hypothetical protein [Salmonella sp. s51884]
MITFLFLKNHKSNSIKPIKEEKINLFFPLLRLAFGTIFVG